jgi:hypothetical protein
MAKCLSFKDFLSVDTSSEALPGAPDYDPDGYLAWLAQKRKRDMTGGPPLAEEFTLLEAESLKAKLAVATGKTKEIAMMLASLRATPTIALKAKADELVRIHSARSKQEYIDLIISSLFGKKALAAHDEYFWPTNKNEDLNEALTAQQRMKKRILMKKIAPKIKLGKERAAKRHANVGALQKRAIALARGLMAKKLLAGKSKGEVSFAERSRVEKIIAKRGATIKRIAAKLLPFLRKREAAKFSNAPAPVAPTVSAK